MIGENIRRLRRIHNLNQTEFSRLIGVSQGSLSDIEAGKSKPAIDIVISIYIRFECSLEWLLTGTNTPSSEQTF
ncbi:helix-turn-helix domain-containing protein [Paenibacillus germinis]|nr:helix-turn-helix transcriptional regulator [Paenibacillus germinis]